MAEPIKISELDAVTPIDGSEILPVVQSGVTRKATVSQLFRNESMVSIEQFYDQESVSDDYSDAFNALITHCQTYGKIAYIPAGEYYMSENFIINSDITIFADNAVFKTDNTSGTFFTFTGSIGSYSSVTESLVSGRNWVKSALSVVADDLVKIKSDEPFGRVVGYNESIGRGEMAVVRNTYNGVIFLHGGLLDNYSIEDWYSENESSEGAAQDANVSIAKVRPIRVSILGNLTLLYDTQTYTSGDSRAGVNFRYCRDLDINLTVKNFPQYGVNLTHCYSGRVNANVYGTCRRSDETSDGAPGYGVQIVGTTMNVKISGTIVGCRHCIATNGSDGVSWNNPIGIIGYGGRSNAIIDAHYPCGSLIVDGSVLIGGSIVVIENSINPAYNVDSGAKSAPYGIEFGARTNIIRNTHIYNCNTAVLPRSFCDCKRLYIENVVFTTCTIGVQTRRESYGITNYLEELILKNVIGTNCGILLYHSGDSFIGDTITMDGCTVSTGRLYVKNTSTIAKASRPKLIIRNCQCTAFNSSTYAISVGEEIGSLYVSGCHLSGFGYGIAISHFLDVLKITDVVYEGDYFVYISGDEASQDRIGLVMLHQSIINFDRTYLLHCTAASQVIDKVIWDNIYAGAGSGIELTNATVETEKEGTNIIIGG